MGNYFVRRHTENEGIFISNLFYDLHVSAVHCSQGQGAI